MAVRCDAEVGIDISAVWQSCLMKSALHISRYRLGEHPYFSRNFR